MVRVVLALLQTAAGAAAGCFSFDDTVAGCAAVSNELVWGGPTEPVVESSRGRSFYDETIWAEPPGRGVRLDGDASFELHSEGRHLVEIFLVATGVWKYSYLLEADGEVVDDRYRAWKGPDRKMPTNRKRRIELLAKVEGPARFTIRTDSPDYVLTAIRWTPAVAFESTLVPSWRQRARWLRTHALFEERGFSPTDRRHRLQQVYSRLYRSEDPAARKDALIGLAGTWYWMAAENHRPPEIARTAKLLHETLAVAPDDLLVRQMISAACNRLNIGRSRGAMTGGEICSQVEPVPWDVAAPQGGPAWATAQLRLVARMDAITGWWVNKRQHTNGELGGGWGDDVEIIRYWGPQALGFGSAVAATGVRKLAAGLWKSEALLDGYSRGVSDVEHSSEPTTDTLPIAAALDPHDARHVARLKQTTACAENWIAKQPDGYYRFRGSWFNCHEVDPSPERAVDVHMNVRAMGPALWYAYLSRDRELIQLLERWGASWAKAMRSTEHGKPAGIIPSALRSSDGSYLVGSDRWDLPDAEWDYFQWSGRSQEALTSLFLALHDLTGKKKWLDAANESFQVLEQCDKHPRLCEEIRAHPSALWETERRRGMADDAPVSDERKLARMAELATEAEQRLAFNFDMFTTEVLYTDRVYYALPAELLEMLFGGEAPLGERYPTFAVTWPAAEAACARAVLESSSKQVRLRLYCFEESEQSIPIRIWRIQPGPVSWEVGGIAGQALAKSLPLQLDLPIPPGKEVDVLIRAAAIRESARSH